MKYKNLIIVLAITIPLFIISGVLSYGENLTYTIAQIQALLDAVNGRVTTSAGVADAGKMIVLDATGVIDTTLYSGGGTGTVDTSGTPVANDIPRFTDANTIEGRSYAELKADLSLEIGTDVQAYSANLTTYAGILPSADVQSVLSAANYAAIKSLMDLEVGVDVQAYSANTTVLGATIGASEVDADVATQAELDAVSALYDTDDELIAIINASPSTCLDVAAGGTGVGTLALNGVLYGKAGADVGVTAIGAAGSILVAGADPFVPIFSVGTGTGVPVRANAPAFTAFPTTPAAAPTTDYQVANKKYIDDAVIGAGGGDVTGVADCADGACLDGSADGGTYVRLYDGDSHYVQIAVPDVAGDVVITTPAVTSTLLAADGTGASLTAVDAITGDSATAFFDAGTIETDFGGTGADLSATTGIMGINAGAYVDVDTAAELELYAGLGAFANEYLDDADAATMRTTLGLAIGTNVEAYDATILKEADVDDIAVNGVDTAPISSNWAFDHVAANDPHSTYLLKSQIGAAYDTSAELDALFLAKADVDATITALAGLTIADVSVIEGTGADAVSMVASGGNNYFFTSNSGNTALEFKTPANALTAIGIVPVAATINAIDDGATTEILVGGGAGVVPVWTTATGTGAPVREGSPTLSGIVTFPIAAAPTTDADGEMSFDTDGWGAGYDALEIWNGTASAYVVAVTASDIPNNGQVPKWNTGGEITWENISAATDINPVDTGDENATFYPILVDGATGTQATETDGELTYNPFTGLFTIPAISASGNVTAATVSSDTTMTVGTDLTITGLDITADGTEVVISLVDVEDAVNEVSISNSSTGTGLDNQVSIIATGGDGVIGMLIDTKNGGTLTLGTADSLLAIASTTFNVAGGAVSGVSSLNTITSGELSQLTTIGLTTIEAGDWVFVAGQDQATYSDSDVEFNQVTLPCHTGQPTSITLGQEYCAAFPWDPSSAGLGAGVDHIVMPTVDLGGDTYTWLLIRTNLGVQYASGIMIGVSQISSG